MSRFYVAPFAIDGEPLGECWRSSDELSGKWAKECSRFIEASTDSAVTAWPDALSHVSTRMTSAEGVAIVTFYVRKVMTTSFLFAKGENPDAERTVFGMFINSLIGTAAVQRYAASSTPFHGILGITQRPLFVVVDWGSQEVSEDDTDLVIDLSLQLASAYFAKG